MTQGFLRERLRCLAASVQSLLFGPPCVPRITRVLLPSSSDDARFR